MTIRTRLVASLVLAANFIWGQGSTAQINGTVRDSSGLAVPGAEVKVTQTATGLVRAAVSTADGDYVFPNLPVGPYMVEVAKEGFNKYVQSGVVLQVDSNPTVDVSLKVGSVAEQVVVRADAAMVETRSTGVGQVVDLQRVLEMPLNGRNATELIFLAGMATLSTNSGFLATVRNYPTVAISVAGGLGNGIAYSLDGANHNDTYNNLNLPLPFPDALQEFKVETSALPAQYGLHSAAAVNAVTKSGTNQIHGDIFEFLRNGDFNARNTYASARDTLKRNQFGGVVGGPVVKDKLFFFAGYQATRQRSDPPQSIAYVPTPENLAGDFRTTAGPLCNGGRTITLGAAQGFVNNQIAPARLNSATLIIQKRLPTSTDPCGKVTYGLKANLNEDLGVAKVDFQKSEKNSMFLRASVSNLDIQSTYDGKNALTENSNAQHDRVYSLAFGDTYLISSSIVSSFRAGLNRTEIPKIVDNFATWKDLGVNASSFLAPTVRLTVSGSGFGIGSGASIYNIANTGPNPNFAEDISWVKGAHQIGFGGQYIHQLINYRSGINATGLPTFNGSVTGLSMADFMIGQAATWVQGNPNILDNRQTLASAYVQDNWKVNSRLSVSYGLRWEPSFSIVGKYGQFAHFDAARFAANQHTAQYTNAPAGQIYPGDPQWPNGNHIATRRLNQFFPRLGVVLDPKGDGKMTIRAAYGMFTDRAALYSLSAFAQDAPYGNVISLNNVNLADPWAQYPGGNPLPIPLTKNITFPNFGAYISYPLNWKPTYIHQWNVSLQRQLATDWLITANYVGNSTFHIVVADQLNPGVFMGVNACTIAGVNYPTCSTTANINQRRVLFLQNPDQGKYYSILSQGSDGGTASYNGLFLSTQKRLSKGVSALANYTLSHCIADLWNGNPGNNGVSAVTPGNRRADRGNCQGIDQRHIFNFSGVFQAPTFSGKALRMLASNWQVAPIVRLRSAKFFTVTAGTDRALNGEGGQRGDLADRNIYPSDPNPAVWINRAAFAIPALGTIGNLGAFNLKGPRVVQFDLALTRTFTVREGKVLQVRGEAFNVTNHVNLDVPVSGLNSGVFGQIQTAGDPRIVQLALKYIF